MTVSQVVEYLQLSETTTYKLVKEGKIPAFKIDLSEFIERLKNGERILITDIRKGLMINHKAFHITLK